jgi:hypothetical protein
MDDFSLQVIDDPPLTISTPLDEYYVGERIPWMVRRTNASGQIRIALLAEERLVAELADPVESDASSGSFPTSDIEPGVYTLQATCSKPQQTVQRHVIITPDPFGR